MICPNCGSTKITGSQVYFNVDSDESYCKNLCKDCNYIWLDKFRLLKNYFSDNTEQLLKEKMAEGWNISIECKGKGREYELTYEGTAHQTGKLLLEDGIILKHGVGNTIEEMLINMFEQYER